MKRADPGAHGRVSALWDFTMLPAMATVPSWMGKAERLSKLLQQLEVTDGKGAFIEHDDAYGRWVERSVELREARRQLFLIGNGASASMASHFAADLAKNARLRTQVFTDLSLVTAISNDIAYEKVYSEPLSWHGEQGDILVAISSSGRSPNILEGARAAREAGMFVVTLSAMGVDNPLRALGDLNLYIPARSYGNAETSHAAVLHHWVDLLTA